MIEMPRRSVTRFFIPLIDVLILLFGMFLLIPFATEADEGLKETSPIEGKKLDSGEPKDAAKLQAELLKALAELKKLKENQGSLSDRLNVRVLEIDAKSGRLFYYLEGDRREVRNELDAERLISDHLKASAPGKKDPFFLILYPRVISGYPEQRQVDDYRRWFRAVPIGFDNPLASMAP